MVKKVVFIMIFLLGILIVPQARAAFIDGVTATASNSWETMPIANIVNGSGLNTANDPATHTSTNWDTSWETLPYQSSAWVLFDLQQNTSVDSFRVWNFNMIQPGPVSFAGRGVKDVNILTSADNSIWSSSTAYVFPKATGTDDYTGTLFSDLGWQDVRYVKFDMLNIWGGGDTGGHFGLSEVQFYTDDDIGGDDDPNAVPEPATMALFGVGLAGMALRRRKV